MVNPINGVDVDDSLLWKEGEGGEDGDEDREEGQGRGGTGEKGSSWRKREIGERECV